MVNSSMFKKLTAILLCLLLVLSFAACGKDKDNSSSDNGSSEMRDPTQDYNDKWGDNENLTDEEKQEVEDLWNELLGNGGAEITTSDSSSSKNSSSQGSSSQGSSSQGSSSQGSSSSDSSSSSSSDDSSSSDYNSSELNASITTDKINGLF